MANQEHNTSFVQKVHFYLYYRLFREYNLEKNSAHLISALMSLEDHIDRFFQSDRSVSSTFDLSSLPR